MSRSDLKKFEPVMDENGEIDVAATRKKNFDISNLPENKQRALSTNNNHKNNMTNKGSIAYMSKPNVKQFNKAMEKRIFNSTGIGRHYAFTNLEELQSEMSEYFDLCKETDTMPTVTSLALWLGCDRDTIYNHANNPNSPFSACLKSTLTYMHSAMENGTLSGDINPVTYIFLAKNYFGMRDDKNINIAPATNDTPINNQETMSALQKQLEQETIQEATYTEKA